MELLIGLPILLFSLITLNLFRNQKKKANNPKDPSDVLALQLSYEEYYKVLNFMLMYGVITPDEYTKFLSQGSAYLG